MTRIVVLPADESACGWYRMRLPAGAVMAQRPDWDVEVYRPTDVLLGVGADGRLWSVKGIPDAKNIDLVVMQRVASQSQVDLVRWFQGNGTAVVVDSDDAMWAIDKANTAWASWNAGPHHWRFLDQAADLADIVTVTTDALAKRYGKRGHAEVLPNCVPGELATDLVSLRPQLDQTTTIGWSGFTATHPLDLTAVGGAVRGVVEDTGCLVRVIGDAAGARRDWNLDTIQAVPPAPMGMPYFTALTSLDIGLVPLRDTAFNKAKSYLKALEFAACGLAVVASDTPANRVLAKTVPIWLASTPGQWQGHLETLIVDREYRGDTADTAREAVFEHHTYEVNAHRWIACWQRAMDRRARMSA